MSNGPSGSRIGRIGDWSNSGSNNAAQPRGTSRFASLSSLSSSGPPRPPVPSDDEEDEDEGLSREGESWFAGGERSGISVQNPGSGSRDPGPRIVQDILRRAAETSTTRPSQPSSGREPSSTFRGGGHTLGSDEVESAYIPDPDAPEEEEEEVAQRNITFWRNGFSVEGGEFYSYEDPANERLLAEINTGRASVSVLNVTPGQPVEVVVSKRVNEDYVPERRPVAAFSGAGNRLGSPTPSFNPGTSTNATMPGSFPSRISPSVPVAGRPADERERINTRFEVDQTLPTATVQIRLADGTRLPCRMNHTHTVRDIRNFINAARPENSTRPYTIGTTFPNRILDDDNQTIKDAGLVNSVVVQRWV
ncbi:ubiquitin-related domain-containing protein [Scleroderma citrinum]